ncbi:hypothetical protein ACGFRB_06350 [Streptomyces sp. NPDC048718]|uniref:hypothetical protein n=1 Tax=Streptomyces sp. NPDC048718 TaxID=3365587 RepID=UPI00371A10C6
MAQSPKPLTLMGPHVEAHREIAVTPYPPAVRSAVSTAVVSRAERRTAVRDWLLSAAPNAQEAKAEWRDYGIAVLACGGVLGAVRVPADLVFAAAGVEGPAAKASSGEIAAVDVFLSNWFDGGAVVMDIGSRQYYFLVPTSMGSQWDPREYPGVECLGHSHYLGVPVVDHTEPEGRAYWAVEMDSPGDLCWPDEVVALLHRGREALGGDPLVARPQSPTPDAQEESARVS